MTTQHSINSLTDDGLAFLNDRLTDIRVALEALRLEPQRDQGPVMERCERILPLDLYNELRAYLGAIEAHHAAICDVLYGEGTDLRVDGLVVGEGNDPHGITITPEVAAARAAMTEPTMFDRLLGQLDRGLITSREFQMVCERERIDLSHPCIEPGCDAMVPFDDEPWCFTHSPDEGSSVSGYSYLISQREVVR